MKWILTYTHTIWGKRSVITSWKLVLINIQSLFLTWYSRFYRGSCRFLCSTTCRFRPAGPGSRSTWGIGCASSCPWCKGGNGLRFCPRSLHTASRTENLCPPVVAGCCLRDSPLSLKTHTEEMMLTVHWLYTSHPEGWCSYFYQASIVLYTGGSGPGQGHSWIPIQQGNTITTHHKQIYQL